MHQEGEKVRSTFAAAAVLIIVTVFVVCSSLYVDSFCTRMTLLCDKLPDTIIAANGFHDVCEVLSREWDKKLAYLRFTIGHSDTEDIVSAIEEMRIRYSTGDTAGYASARARLRSLLDEMRKAELFSFYAVM